MKTMARVWSSPRRNGPAVSALIAGILLFGAAMFPAHAEEKGLSLSDAWIRSLVPSRPAAGYFTVKNNTDKVRKLVSASSSACGMLMMHYSRQGSGSMEMVDSVAVPAHGSVAFKPGGYHLMCMKPSDTVKPGNTARITLAFDDGGTLTADFPVRNAKGE